MDPSPVVRSCASSSAAAPGGGLCRPLGLGYRLLDVAPDAVDRDREHALAALQHVDHRLGRMRLVHNPAAGHQSAAADCSIHVAEMLDGVAGSLERAAGV